MEFRKCRESTCRNLKINLHQTVIFPCPPQTNMHYTMQRNSLPSVMTRKTPAIKLYSSRNSIWVVTLGWRWLTVGTPCCVCFCFALFYSHAGKMRHAQMSSQQLRSGSPFRRILRQFWKTNCDDSLELPTNLKIDQSCILLRNTSQNHRR